MITYIRNIEMVNIIGHYERIRKAKNDKNYQVVRKDKIGNLDRNIYIKNNIEYVKYNGKYMQLKNYKTVMKNKGLYRSPEPSKECKKDCESLNKMCNKKTGRCNIKKSFDGNKECKKDCRSLNKMCNKKTGRCNKI
jgi:hypothetical protein